MHGMAPRGVLGRPWWDEIRQKAYRSTSYHCVACGVHKYKAKFRQHLEGHELYEIDYLLGRMEYVETVPLCHCCHNYIHDGRLAALLDAGEITHGKYATIIQHGDRILYAAGLQKEVYIGEMAEWGEWRLVVNDKEYQPKFKTPEEWAKEYDNG